MGSESMWDAPEDPTSDEAEEALVLCRDVTHRYQRGGGSSRWPWVSIQSSPPVTALEDISLRVDRGEVVGLEGPSGSGKSTLLHLIAGLTTATSGSIELVGNELTGLSERRRSKLRREHVGFVFQRFHLLPTLSARANVALPLVQLGVDKAERRSRAESLLDRVGLADRLTHTPARLSGGEQQRVAIARALVTDPAVILADEPTGELDTETSEQVLTAMTELADDRAIVLASHDETALAVTDRILQLHDGRVLSDD